LSLVKGIQFASDFSKFEWIFGNLMDISPLPAHVIKRNSLEFPHKFILWKEETRNQNENNAAKLRVNIAYLRTPMSLVCRMFQWIYTTVHTHTHTHTHTHRTGNWWLTWTNLGDILLCERSPLTDAA
jgi:hypothetical protein